MENNNDIETLLQEGLRQYAMSNAEGALAAWFKVLDQEPKHPRAHEYVEYVRKNFDIPIVHSAFSSEDTATEVDAASDTDTEQTDVRPGAFALSSNDMESATRSVPDVSRVEMATEPVDVAALHDERRAAADQHTRPTVSFEPAAVRSEESQAHRSAHEGQGAQLLVEPTSEIVPPPTEVEKASPLGAHDTSWGDLVGAALGQSPSSRPSTEAVEPVTPTEVKVANAPFEEDGEGEAPEKTLELDLRADSEPIVVQESPTIVRYRTYDDGDDEDSETQEFGPISAPLEPPRPSPPDGFSLTPSDSRTVVDVAIDALPTLDQGDPIDDLTSQVFSIWSQDQEESLDLDQEPIEPGIFDELLGAPTSGASSSIAQAVPHSDEVTELEQTVATDELMDKGAAQELLEKAVEQATAPRQVDCVALMEGARELFSLGDFSGSLELVEKVLKVEPEHAAAVAYLAKNEETLLKMYKSKLGDTDNAPRLLTKPDEVVWMNLHHRAGFLLSQVDGILSYEDLVAVSGMPRLETFRILVDLVQNGVIGQ